MDHKTLGMPISEAALPQNQLEAITLRFKKKDVEHAFGIQAIAKATRSLYTALIMSSVTSLLVFFVDYAALGRFDIWILLLRVVLFPLANAGLGILLVLGVPKTRRHLNLMGTAFVILSQMFQFWISFAFPELGQFYLLILLMLSILPTITLTGLSFRYLIPISLILLAAFVTKVLVFDDGMLSNKLFQVLVSVMFMGIVLATGYLLERAERVEYWVIQGLTAQREALSAKNRELEQFAYIASHDLQEPLRSITSFTQLLEEDYGEKIGEDGARYLKFLLEASERMRRLIKGLLDYSRLGRESAVARVDVAAMLKEIVADLGVAIGECQAQVLVGPMPVMNVFELEFRMLLQNLLSNALKFRKAGVAPVVEVKARQVSGAWEFSVHDNGIGIAKEHQQKIFLIFQRLHTRNQYDGTGIGLANCQKIVAMHGGKIWVESEKDQGSTFRFTIPIH